ncbi:D-alanyl-D-alanine endopeptidase [Rubrivivax rivuli]|uniref:D-alanyl-D-alanine endopeptidase n=1 Tax=Rubrivivax rivuli TaxID=1862385 RepID=A0A437RFA6_9BURK|nr:D-alanyl-D-alanine endopeptidase [Rubrivivax rivuli]RVU45431.1 D-alanyl-D-alanine endopeptidase [Rubrivivax rivuli]
MSVLAFVLGAGSGAQAQSNTGAKNGKATSSKSAPAAKPAAKAQAGKQGPARVAKAPVRKAKVASASRKRVVRAEPVSASFGHQFGLQKAEDALDLKSSVALVVDQDTDEVLFSKNPEAVLPIASITKLMTALVVTEAALPLDEMLVVTQDDVDATAGSTSRLRVATQLNRGEMLHLALMASENRAAHVLGRTYPGGIRTFVAAMNAKAQLLGMSGTRFVEPTGLSSDNQSSAADLTRLVRAASAHPVIADLSTSLEASVPVGSRQVQFRNTNGLVRNPEWEIGLQKTGYIAAAGRCLVMQTQLAGRKLIMVLLDSAGKYSRMGDAERIRKWLASAPFVPSAVAAPLPARPALAPAPTEKTLLGPSVSPVSLPGAPAVPADQPR